MKLPLISVIIPALNAEKTIEDCIKSLLNQRYQKRKYEIVFVDNGSTDNTLKILQNFRKRIKILNEPKKGSYYARNKGIRSAKGEIIAFTDSDCIADRNWLLAISNVCNNKDIKIVGGKIKSFERDSILLRYCDKFCHTQEFSVKSKTPFFATANMAVRKKDLNIMGYFNSSFVSGGDIELCHRIIKNKEEIYYEPKAVVKHIYNHSLLNFIRKHYNYGKLHKSKKQDLRFDYSVKLYSHIKIMRKYGIIFLLFRILQDISYKLGLIFGKTKNVV